MYLGVEMWMFFAALSSSSIFLRVCHMTLDDVLISQKYINVIFFFVCAYITVCMIALMIPPQIIKLVMLIVAQCAISTAHGSARPIGRLCQARTPHQVHILCVSARPQHRRRPLARPRHTPTPDPSPPASFLEHALEGLTARPE